MKTILKKLFCILITLLFLANIFMPYTFAETNEISENNVETTEEENSEEEIIGEQDIENDSEEVESNDEETAEIDDNVENTPNENEVSEEKEEVNIEETAVEEKKEIEAAVVEEKSTNVKSIIEQEVKANTEIKSENTINNNTTKAILNQKSSDTTAATSVVKSNTKKYEQTIADGEYRIRSAKDTSKYIGVANGSTQNGAKIELATNQNQLEIIFNIKYLEDGYYKITSAKSGKALDVPGASKNVETKLNQYTYNGTDAQKWIIKDIGNGKYSIISKCNNLYMDLTDGKTAIGTKVQMYKGNGTAAQQFIFKKVQHEQGKKTIVDGEYRIRSAKDTSKYVGVANGSTQNGAKIELAAKSNELEIIFNIKYLGDGYYKITSAKSGKVLDVPGANRSVETKLNQYTYNGSNAQKWIIKSIGNGKYSIISKCNDLYMDLTDGKTAIGTKVQMYTGNGTAAQQFLFQKVQHEQGKQTIADGEYRIRSAKDTSKYIGVANGSTQNGAKIELAAKNNELEIIFNIKYLGDGYYKITSAKSGKALDVPGANRNIETKLNQYAYNGTAAQKWIIKDVGNGKYSIISKCNDLYMDLTDGKTAIGTKVQMYTGNGTAAQQFLFQKVQHEQGKQTIADGVYKIKSVKDSKKLLEIKNADKNNSASLVLNKDLDKKNQKFQIKYIGQGYYSITAAHSKKVLDVPGASRAIETKLQQYTSNSTDAQKWIIKDVGNGKYSIISKCNDLYMDLTDGKTAIGTKVQMYTGNGTTAQQFTFEKTEAYAVPNGIYEIETALKSNAVLDISEGKTDNKANLQLWKQDDVNQQKFRITHLGNDYYKIEAVHSKKVLSLASNSKENGVNVWQYEYNDGDAQKWKITDLGNGTYKISSKYSGLYLNVSNTNANNGTNVNVAKANNSKAQIFSLKPTTIKEYKGIDVSEFNGNINWSTVKNQGIDFVIVRLGYRGYRTGKIVIDSKALDNLKGAKAQGLKVGVYFYTQAINEAEGKEEANWCINTLKQNNITIDYPIVIDTERSTADADNPGRADELDKNTRTKACKAFCDTIKSKGKIPMVYASTYWFYDNLDLSKFTQYYVWLANYTRAELNRDFAIWQYTSKGKVSGISGNVDLDIGYVNFN